MPRARQSVRAWSRGLDEMAAANYAKSHEADTKKDDGRRFRHWRSQEADELRGVFQESDDLPHVVDAESLRNRHKAEEGRVDLGEAPPLSRKPWVPAPSEKFPTIC